MKILHLRVSNFYGGPERQIHNHLREARRHGLDVTLGTLRPAGDELEWLDPLRADGLETLALNVAGSYDPAAIRALARLVRADGFDIVCTHDYRTSAIAALATRRTSAKWVAFSRGYTRENLRVRAFHLLDLSLMRTAHRVVAVSHAQARRLKRALIPSRRVTVVHNAVAPQEFESVAPIDLRKGLSLAPEAIVGVAGGRFSPEKGQTVLVEAAARALQRCPRLRLVLFGTGPDLDRVRDLAQERGIADRVLTPGFETNMVGALKGADFAVNPSLSEGLPNILLEAMAVRTPVVATAVGGVPELVEHEVTGLLAPAKDPVALAELLVTACEEQARMQELAERAYDNVVDHFSFAAQYRTLAILYGDLSRGS